MKRLLLLALVLAVLVSCSPAMPQSEETPPKTEEWMQGENRAALSRNVVRNKLLPLLYGEKAPIFAELAPAYAEEYKQMEGKNIKDALAKFGLPYDLGEGPEQVRYVSREGHDVWVFLNHEDPIYEVGRVLHVEVNTREQAQTLLSEKNPDLHPTQTVWILRSLGDSGTRDRELKDYVEHYGFPFSLEKKEDLYRWYYLTDLGSMLLLEVAEDNGSLVIRSQRVKKAGEAEFLPIEQSRYPILKPFLNPLEGRKLSQEKTGAWLQQLYADSAFFSYSPLPLCAKEEQYLALAAEGCSLDEMLSRFGVPYDVKQEEKEGEFHCRYFTDAGEDAVITLRDYGEGFAVDKVTVNRRTQSDTLLRSRYPQMKALSSEPAVAQKEGELNLGWESYELMRDFGAPYLDSAEFYQLYSRYRYCFCGYYLTWEGERIAVSINLDENGAVTYVNVQ